MLAELLERASKVDAALETRREAAKLLRGLASSAPDNREYRQNLAHALFRVARMEMIAGNLETSGPLLAECLELTKALATSAAANPFDQHIHTDVLEGCAEQRYRMARESDDEDAREAATAEARQFLRECAEFLEKLRDDGPEFSWVAPKRERVAERLKAAVSRGDR